MSLLENELYHYNYTLELSYKNNTLSETVVHLFNKLDNNSIIEIIKNTKNKTILKYLINRFTYKIYGENKKSVYDVLVSKILDDNKMIKNYFELFFIRQKQYNLLCSYYSKKDEEEKKLLYEFLKQDPEYCLFLGKSFSFYNENEPFVKYEFLSNIVINSSDTNLMIKFAKNVKFVNIKLFEKIIILKNDAKAIYHFAKEVKMADIVALENAIIKNGSEEYIFEFAKYINGANINKLYNGILNSNNPIYIYLFVSKFDNIDIIPALEKLMAIKEYKYFIKIILNNDKFNINKLPNSGMLFDFVDKLNISPGEKNILTNEVLKLTSVRKSYSDNDLDYYSNILLKCIK